MSPDPLRDSADITRALQLVGELLEASKDPAWSDASNGVDSLHSASASWVVMI
jgi:hypothetical protein